MNKNLTYRQQKIVEILNLDLNNTSPKGWIYGGTCPFCNRNDKFGVKLNFDRTTHKNHISFNCFHGSCQAKGTEYKLLKQLDMLHIIQVGEFIGEKQLEKKSLISFDEKQLDLELPDRHPPFGFRRLKSNEYLESRGFEPWQFDVYTIGKTKLVSKLKKYVIFLIEENHKNKGYVARLEMTSEQQRLYESKTGKKLTKYINEAGVDFGKLLFGIDEVSEQTTHVILVEGVTDKSNVDRQLKLYQSPETKCLCTFGKKMSIEQMTKLHNKGVMRITLLYDPDAVNASKKYSNQLNSLFSQVKVGYLHEKDPGEATANELQEAISRAVSPIIFNIDKVQKYKI